MGRVVQFEHLGALDGPGLRSIVFLSGCPLRCRYCHNADFLLPETGNEMSASEVLAEVERYRDYCTGGVTLSGGEPLGQTGFAIELLDEFKKAGIHTALDTSGYVFSPTALDKADLVILDIKHTDPKGFKSLTNGDINNTLRTLEYLKQIKKPFWIRQVIVKGITDQEEQLLRLKELSRGADKVELLAYHTMGNSKWRKIGLQPPLEGVEPTDEQTMARCRKIIDN